MAVFLEGPLPGLHTAAFSLCPHMGKRKSSGVSISSSFFNPTMGAVLISTYLLPEASPPAVITLGVRISMEEFGGTQHSVCIISTYMDSRVQSGGLEGDVKDDERVLLELLFI